MSSNKKSFDVPRQEMLQFWPQDVLIKGYDDEDKTHPLYDPRCEVDDVDDDFIQSFIRFGAIRPIFGTKIDDQCAKVDGQRRLRGLRAANDIIRARAKDPEFIAEFGEGKEPMRVKVMMLRGSFDEMLKIAALANSGAVPETTIQKAARAQVMLDGMAKSKLDEPAKLRQIAHAFAVSPAAVRQWLTVARDASVRVRNAVDTGKINATTALKIITGSETKGEQDETLDKVLSGEEKVTSGKAARAAAETRRAKKPAKAVGDKDKESITGTVLGKRRIMRALRDVRANPLRLPRDVWEHVELALLFVLGADISQWDDDDKLKRTLLGKHGDKE